MAELGERMAAAVEQVEQAIFIQLARPSVAAFLLNPLHEVIWCSGVQASHPSQEGRMVPGMVVRRDVKFWGHAFNVTYQVVGVQGDAGVDLRITQPWTMSLRYDLSAEPSGTRVTLRAEVEAGGFFKVTGSLLRGMVIRRLRRDLLQLKRHLEHASWTSR